MSRDLSPPGKRLVAGLLLALVVGAAGYAAVRLYRQEPATPVAPAPSAPTDSLVDPLAPERLVRLDPSPRPTGTANWVSARPGFQSSLSSKERGGVNPCALPAADTSAFTDWSSLSKGRFIAPRTGSLDDTGGFDLILHFLGDDLARRELILSGEKAVLYSLTLGTNQSYPPLFAGTKLYSQLVRQIEHALSVAHGVPAHARRVALSAWSAGFMGVVAVLVQPEGKDIDSVVLIDGLHAARGRLEHELEPFEAYARRAAAGERFLLVTHSSIDPPNFASTTESAHHLIAALGARPEPVRRDDGMGLELIEYFSRGNFHVRGYAGNDKADHCAQVTLLRSAYAAIGRRWRSAG